MTPTSHSSSSSFSSPSSSSSSFPVITAKAGIHLLFSHISSFFNPTSHLRNLRIDSSFSPRKGFTLMELILSIALLSILAAASFGVLFWQAKTYYHIEQRSEAMAQLTNTYMVIYKEVKTWSRGSIDTATGNQKLKRLGFSDFDYDSSSKELSWKGEPILKDAIVSFGWSPAQSIATGTLTKQINRGGTLTNVAAIKFVIHPRNN